MGQEKGEFRGIGGDRFPLVAPQAQGVNQALISIHINSYYGTQLCGQSGDMWLGGFSVCVLAYGMVCVIMVDHFIPESYA